MAVTCRNMNGVNLEYSNKSTSSLTHLLVVLKRYYKMLGPTIKEKMWRKYFIRVCSAVRIDKGEGSCKVELWSAISYTDSDRQLIYAVNSWFFKSIVNAFSSCSSRRFQDLLKCSIFLLCSERIILFAKCKFPFASHDWLLSESSIIQSFHKVGTVCYNIL
jgi:hypothetical protein